MSRSRLIVLRLLFGVTITTGLSAAVVSGQSAAAPQLKAVFLFNFSKYTTWPELPPDSPLVLCVAGDEVVAKELVAAVRGQRVAGRGLSVSNLAAGASVRPCQILFVSASSMAASGPLLDAARKLPVLTVGDAPGFAQSAGIIEFFVEGNRMRFAVNLDVLERSRLRLSSHLLSLAKIVRDKT